MILAVDSGTTSTRVWALYEGEVRGGALGRAGARDIAQAKDRRWLAARVRELADEALTAVEGGWSGVDAVVAFGMITSELGLEELPHLAAPVDRETLAAGMRRRRYAALPVPVYLVPGVRCGSNGDLRGLDFMRGEETEVTGLLASGRAEPPLLYVSAGSHTKLVAVDSGARIEWSLSTLSGELLWALHRETILTEFLDPSGGVQDVAWVEEGARFVEGSGLSRALFAARVLNRVRGASAAACSDFVHGAVAASDLASLRRALEQRGTTPSRIVLGGEGPLAEAYGLLLAREPWVERVQEVDEPLGPMGAWALYTTTMEAGGGHAEAVG